MKDLETLDLFDKYRNEELSPAERVDFDRRLTIDSDFRKEFTQYLSVIKSIQLEHMRSKISKVNLELAQDGFFSSSLQKDIPIKSSKRFPYLAAASILLIFAVGLMYFVTKDYEANYFVKNYEEPAWPIERGEMDDIGEACSLHLQKRDEEALKKLYSSDSITVIRKYWIAEILVHSGRFDEARPLLEELERQGYESERVTYMQTIINKPK